MKKIFMVLAVVGGVSFSMASCSAEVTTNEGGEDTEHAEGDHDHAEGEDHAH